MVTNGKLDLATLAGVDHFVPLYGYVNADVGSNLLLRQARDQLRLLQGAFEKAIGRPLNISEGYRSLDAQWAAWRRHLAGTGNLAAYPGTSNHGLGLSCDFGSGVGTYGSVAKVWMDANAPAYGWKPTGNGFTPREGWHFDYVGNPTITTASSGAVAITPQLDTALEGEPDMLVFANLDTDRWAAAWPGHFEPVPSGHGDEFVAASGTSLRRVNDKTFVALRDIYLHMHPNQVYAITTTNAWVVVGPGVYFEIPSGQGGNYEAVYGTRRAVTPAELAEIRKRHGV